ncbi:hypothetical protein PM082_022971 [Marasmius tenuissimus]|nr:hypothetical protein PM082_022971 [Marasmius tenuissimus]
MSVDSEDAALTGAIVTLRQRREANAPVAAFDPHVILIPPGYAGRQIWQRVFARRSPRFLDYSVVRTTQTRDVMHARQTIVSVQVLDLFDCRCWTDIPYGFAAARSRLGDLAERKRVPPKLSIESPEVLGLPRLGGGASGLICGCFPCDFGAVKCMISPCDVRLTWD